MSRIYDEEWLGSRLRILRPAPQGLVQAAQELPDARRSLDEIVARAEADLAFRAALIADLEDALTQAGFEPGPRALEELRKRFEAS